MLRSFWVWFAFLTAGLSLSIARVDYEGNALAARLLAGALLLAAFFVAPLFRRRPKPMTAVLCLSALFATAAVWPLPEAETTPYTLLVFSLLAGKAVYRLPLRMAGLVGLFALAGAAAPGWMGLPSWPPAFLGMYAAAFAACSYVFGTLQRERDEAAARNEELLSEYRSLKRRLATNEEAARQEERTQVAREIHDSVGHKLTALLMQLEVQRMQASEETQPMLAGLKMLAKESLEETRGAVKLLNQQETGGLTAIVGLLRRLEAENFMRIQFTIRDGALTAPLSNPQSVAVYRSVQEALTNAMRHGHGREANVTFEAPGGGSVFRFEVTNPCKQGTTFAEGFGLRSMRERVEQAGGRIEAAAYHQEFVVRGTIPLRGENET
ncbi:histidine kinase [Paenibacillus sp. TRM 82003]|nr:histidine kinase [Paenibacillus sp. TRM 82003]